MGREIVALGTLAVLISCGKDKPKPPPAPAPDRAASQTVLAEKAFYRIEPGPRTPCSPGAACEAFLAFSALGDYHVNDRYPFKFIADPVPGVAVDGTGTFTLDDAKHGMMKVAFRATKHGPARLAGTFKLSVCTDDVCEIEEPKLAFEIPVE